MTEEAAFEGPAHQCLHHALGGPSETERFEGFALPRGS
jgi:hypothetical protein